MTYFQYMNLFFFLIAEEGGNWISVTASTIHELNGIVLLLLKNFVVSKLLPIKTRFFHSIFKLFILVCISHNKHIQNV